MKSKQETGNASIKVLNLTSLHSNQEFAQDLQKLIYDSVNLTIFFIIKLIH